MSNLVYLDVAGGPILFIFGILFLLIGAIVFILIFGSIVLLKKINNKEEDNSNLVAKRDIEEEEVYTDV